ncbi:MAG: PASTA domain-containing protein [Clostridia bacterium]|nr:PASTA domain-containing protein [Clostridia bacterium]
METYNKYIGKVFDNRYRIEKIIGLGGMAVVFKATDLSYGRSVAVKMLREDMAKDPTNVIRFENESKAVVLLEHENIVKIYDVSVSGTLKYFVMEYLEGITLKEYMKKRGGRLEVSEVVSCAEQILRALEHAHSKGIIHRDIKPQNIMLMPNGQIKVTDFGIAKLPSAETVTMEDKAIGTVYYISPEQASGKKVDSRTDIYSLGALLYEMATGVLPYDGDNSVSIALMHIKEDPVLPRQLDKRIPEGLEQLIVKAMKRTPAERFQTASEMLSCVMRLKKNPGTSLRLKRKNGKTKEHGGTSMFPITLGAACAFIVALIIAAVYMINVLFINPAKNEDEFKVESYVSLFYNEELEQSIKEKFSKVNIEYEYSDEFDSGFVLEQSVAPNLIRKIKASEITLTISIGREQMEMPDLRYYSLNEAIAEISNLNFDLKITQVKRSDDAIEEGYLITTDPAPKELVNKGDTITLIVSEGEQIDYVSVPNLVYDSQKKNRTEEQAYKLLTDAGLKIGNITRIQSIDYEAGLVLEQSIPTGEKVASGVTSIDLVISGGLDGEVSGDSMYMIDVTESTLDAAIAKLQSYELDFVIKTESVNNNIYPEGVICSTSPEAKVKVNRGDTITLYVSAGAATLVTVPDLRGMTQQQAIDALKNASLNVGTVSNQYSSTVEIGLVANQSEEANTEVPQGTVVNITISKGPTP